MGSSGALPWESDADSAATAATRFFFNCSKSVVLLKAPGRAFLPAVALNNHSCLLSIFTKSATPFGVSTPFVSSLYALFWKPPSKTNCRVSDMGFQVSGMSPNACKTAATAADVPSRR
jgi:hypothetical protein